MKAAIIGYGYWGKNVARNFIRLLGESNVVIYDSNPERLAEARSMHGTVELSTQTETAFSRNDIGISAIITPVSSHYSLALQALRAGHHVFLEKPMAESSQQCRELKLEAARQNKLLMIDHTFLFTPAVRKIKEIVDSGEIGELLYFDSYRVNLGLFQHDVNVLYDLAPHDISILNYLVGDQPRAVRAEGFDLIRNGLVSVAFVTITYEHMIAHFNMSWLSPVKMRHIMIAGTKKMIVWNHLDPDEPLKIYDKGIDLGSGEHIHDLLISYRSGDVYSPRLDQTEALLSEISYFLSCIQNGTSLEINGPDHGERVVSIIEEAQDCLEKNGASGCR